MFLLLLIFLLEQNRITYSFSFSSSSSNTIDRFRVSCPADTQAIKQFDSNISVLSNNGNNEEEEVWCAVYRSNNNLPSVLMRDDFFQSMKIATTNPNTVNHDNASDNIVSSLTIDDKIPYATKSTPVAIGRLRKKQSSDIYILDTLRCVFKKENLDDKCDGGSEHTDAISLCIDTLFIHYLKQVQKQRRMSELQCKSTLVSSPLVESRGFTPIIKLNKDMTTHCIDNYDVCMEMYANKVASTTSADSTNTQNILSPMSRMNALDILSLLGQLDYNNDDDKMEDQTKNDSDNNDEEEEENDYDPWASIKQFI